MITAKLPQSTDITSFYSLQRSVPTLRKSQSYHLIHKNMFSSMHPKARECAPAANGGRVNVRRLRQVSGDNSEDINLIERYVRLLESIVLNTQRYIYKLFNRP